MLFRSLGLDEAGLDEAEVRTYVARPRGWIDLEASAIAELDRAVERSADLVEERRRVLRAHEASRPQVLDVGEAEAVAAAARARCEDLRTLEATLRARALADDAQRDRAASLRAAIAREAPSARRWDRLASVIGSADGARLQRFAQGLTLDVLLAHANTQLAALTPRYALQRVPGGDLDVQVIDRDMADEVRAVASLSGGETFLASLALALGLASLAAETTPVRSLFIDEGFGTLDRETLEVAIAALDALQHQGRQVGIISHVDGLAEQIGVRVSVERVSAGTSRVVIRTG